MTPLALGSAQEEAKSGNTVRSQPDRRFGGQMESLSDGSRLR